METQLLPQEGRLEFAKYLRSGFSFELYKRLMKDCNLAFMIIDTKDRIESYVFTLSKYDNTMTVLGYEDFSCYPFCDRFTNLKLAFETSYYRALLNIGKDNPFYTVGSTYLDEVYQEGSIVALFTEDSSIFPINFEDSEGNITVAPL